jgi:hypothetical protein
LKVILVFMLCVFSWNEAKDASWFIIKTHTLVTTNNQTIYTTRLPENELPRKGKYLTPDSALKRKLTVDLAKGLNGVWLGEKIK